MKILISISLVFFTLNVYANNNKNEINEKEEIKPLTAKEIEERKKIAEAFKKYFNENK